MKLYIPTVKGHRNVKMRLFHPRQPEFVYENLVPSELRDGEMQEDCARSVVNNAFTGDEVVAVRRYLKKRYPDCPVTIEEWTPPRKHETGASWCWVGDGAHVYTLSDELMWNLPFEVCGYYDLRDSEAGPGE